MKITELNIGERVVYKGKSVTVVSLHECGRVEVLDGYTYIETTVEELEPLYIQGYTTVINKGNA